MPDLIPVDGDPFGAAAWANVPRTAEGIPVITIDRPAPRVSPPDAPAAQGSTSDDAPPVTLTPVDGNPFTPPAPPPDYGIDPNVAAAMGGSLYEGLKGFLSIPGNVAGGQQPQTPGQWSDVDEATRQANMRGEQVWGPQTALMMVGGGGPAAEKGAAAIAGGRLTQPAADVAATAPRFYSTVENAVANSATKSAPAEQWLGAIRNTPGVKPEEVDWLGLEPWLKAQKGNVSKDQIADYIRGNKVDVREVENREGGSDAEVREFHDISEPFWNTLKDRERAELRSEFMADAAYEVKGDTKYGPGTGQGAPLPGGENYRELLLTLPQKMKPTGRFVVTDGSPSFNMATNTRTEAEDVINNLQRHSNRPLQIVPEKAPDRDAVFTGSHWDEPNVLAHVRFDDRKIGNDNSLHMAEIQSDWHQKGRRDGYQPQAKRSMQEVDADIDANRTALLRREPEIDAGSAESWQNAWDRHPDLQQRERDLYRERGHLQGAGRGVPDAPFKTTWPELSLKRMIRYAAENGYDRLSWDTGATNADRYDLSKQISEVRFTRHGTSGFTRPEEIDHPAAGGTLQAYDLNGRGVMDRYIETPQELADHIGKEAAEKLLAQKGKYGVVGGTANVRRDLKGLDLKVGGEGMAGFYDRMLPAAANKLGKKYGAQVERSEVPAFDKEAADNWDRAYPDETIKREKFVKPVWSLKITPALRKAALEQGFPLFAIGGIATGAVAQHHLHPVDHDPFAAQLVPVDHNPFTQ